MFDFKQDFWFKQEICSSRNLAQIEKLLYFKLECKFKSSWLLTFNAVVKIKVWLGKIKVSWYIQNKCWWMHFLNPFYNVDNITVRDMQCK